MSHAQGDSGIVPGSALFGGAEGGRWATAQLKAAALSGKPLSSQSLRTLDTLRHEEWKFFDDVLIEEAKIRLVGVGDLIRLGLVTNVPNALGKTVLGYEKISDMDPATVSLDGLGRTPNDWQEFQLNQIPLPITHKDFFLNLRALSASRTSGEPLDTIHVRTAGRVVAEKAESMLFVGGPTYGGMPIYGYTTHPNRNTGAFDGANHWGVPAKTGASYLADMLAAIAALHADRMYGPYLVYVPADAGVQIEKDYNAGSANPESVKQRLMKISSVLDIRTADQLPSANVVVVQATADVVTWVNGESLRTVQWDEGGGFKVNFKAWQIAVPLVRADMDGRSGVFHLA
jgi:uncharacterized linocin/CFP29 family protein